MKYTNPVGNKKLTDYEKQHGEKTKMENEKQDKQEEKTKQETETPKVVGQMELPQINFSDYNGVKAKVDIVELEKGNFGYYYKVSTQPLTTLGTGENAKPIRASIMLGLYHDKEKDVYGWGDDSKTAQFLKKYDVEKPEELMNKEVLVTVEIKDKKQFLRIV